MDIKVMLVDDDDLVRNSLAMILQTDPVIKVVSTCQNGDIAFKELQKGLVVDVIMMDIRMPICDGVEATRRIMELYPKMKIIILTTFDDDEYLLNGLKYGAKGYLLKNTNPDKIMESIKVVNSGSVLIQGDVSPRLVKMLKGDSDSFLDSYDLSSSERDIIKLISQGITNKEIADKLFLSEGTVKNKITQILNKLDLRDRTQIAIFYLKGGQ
ncbi:response regulator [Alkalicella caledoniensis]|nr:response regulator transcription factor [Alkalicella caledoniensis]